MHASLLRSISLVSLVSSLAVTQGDVLVVGPGGFGQIQAAVEAAQDGDTILVRIPAGTPPAFSAVEIAGKSLTIVADSDTELARVRSVDVHDLPSGKTVVLSRVSVTGGANAPAIRVWNNAGNVRLVACDSRGRVGGFGSLLPVATPGLTVASSSGSMALASCAIVGGRGGHADEYPGLPGAAGLELQDATVVSFDSTITGGEGGPLVTILDSAGQGGRGAKLEHDTLPTRLLLSNSSIQGGQGGEVEWCYPGQSYPSGNGGTGLALGPDTSVTLHASTLAGGPGGDLGVPCGVSGSEGEALLNDAGFVHENPTTALQLTTPTVAREGQTITLTIAGVLGDQVTVVSGLQTTFREVNDGVLLVDPGYRAFPRRGPVGTIGPSGVLTLTHTFPQLPSGIDALNVWFQARARHADGKRTLGSFAVITVLDSAF